MRFFGQGMLLFLIVRLPCEIHEVTVKRISLGSRSGKTKTNFALLASSRFKLLSFGGFAVQKIVLGLNPILLLFNWYDKPEIIGEYLA